MEKSQHYCYQLHLGDPVSDPVQCKNKNYPDPKNKSASAFCHLREATCCMSGLTFSPWLRF